MIWPFTRKTAPFEETKSLANPSPELLAIFGGLGFGSLSEAQALSVPAVSSAIRLISEAAANLQICVKRKTGDTESDAPDHPAHKLLNGQVNEWTSSFEFIRDLVATALVSDVGGLAIVTRVRGEPREIISYRRGSVSVEYDTVTDQPHYRNNGTVIAPSAVVHVRAPFGRAPLTLAGEAIAVSKAMETHAGNLWRNGSRPGGMLKAKGNMAEPAIEKAKAFWQAAHGGAENSGKTAFMPFDLEFQQLAMASTDAQFLENRKFQTIEICRAFRIPPSMLFELDRATWSNSEQMGKEFLSYTLAPWLRAVEAALNRALFTASERDQGYRVAFDEDDLTRADFGARATAYSSAISARWMSPNDVRKYEGLPPYSGGDEYKNPAIDKTPSSDQPVNDNSSQEANVKPAPAAA